MSEHKKSKAKMMLPGILLVTSVYYSMAFAVGIVLGYLISHIFCKLFVNNGKVGSIFIDWGKWTLHLHHWIMGAMVLVGVWLIYQQFLPALLTGAICGLIVQDIYDYNDWHQVLIKNDDAISL